MTDEDRLDDAEDAEGVDDAEDAGVAGLEAETSDRDAETDDVIEEVEDDIDSLLRERDELIGTSRRLQADFENYRKRVVREQAELVERSTARLVEQLLPVLDSFELAVLNLEGVEVDAVKVRKGVDLVYAELFAVLERAGLSRIEGTGAAFDPTQHEAVLHDEGDAEPVVAEVMRSGWRLKGRVLRPAMVKVTRAGSRAERRGNHPPGASDRDDRDDRDD